MLWDVERGVVIDRIPYKNDYNRWIARLNDEQIQMIRCEILLLISGDEIVTAGWLPGDDWTGSPFQSIYDIACNSDYDQSAKFFGLMVWTTLMDHEYYWGFGHYELNGIPIRSMTYFIVHPSI